MTLYCFFSPFTGAWEAPGGDRGTAEEHTVLLMLVGERGWSWWGFLPRFWSWSPQVNEDVQSALINGSTRLVAGGVSRHLGFPCSHVCMTSHSSVSFTRGISADSKSGYEERILLVHLGEPMKCQYFCAAMYGTAIHRPVEWRLSRPVGEFRFNFISKQPSFPINIMHTYWVPGRHPSTFSN